MTTEKRYTKLFTPPTEQDVAVYAYFLWEADGRPQGRDVEHWLQARAHLTADCQYEAEAGLLPTRSKTVKPPEVALVTTAPRPATESGTAPAKRRKKAEAAPAFAIGRAVLV